MTPEQLQAIEPMTRAELEARGWEHTEYFDDLPPYVGRGGCYISPDDLVEIFWFSEDDTEARRAATVLSILWGLV